jgi:hypothetical protein
MVVHATDQRQAVDSTQHHQPATDKDAPACVSLECCTAFFLLTMQLAKSNAVFDGF